MKSDPQDLKNAMRVKRAGMSANHGMRLHRAISKLKCASALKRAHQYGC